MKIRRNLFIIFSNFNNLGYSSVRMQHLLEIILAAIKFEEAHFDTSKEEWKKWKEYCSATYLNCQLCHLSVQHMQARIGRYQRF